MATCKYCGTATATEVLCSECHRKLGLTAGEGVRKALPCQRCNHPELIRALARELATGAGEVGQRELHPMTVTLEPVGEHGFFSGKPKGVGGGFAKLVGVLEMYVCRRCGFTEWYCRDPQNVPIGEHYGTEIVTVEPDAPFR
ncbi:MAG: hypothetical protein ACKV2T_32450 [Kofleriaceae bacterium]